MHNQATDYNSSTQAENFTVTNSPQAGISDCEDNLQIAVSPEEKFILKIPVTLDPSVFAHEIRNPLTSIKLAVFMLKTQSTAVNVDKYLDIIDRSSLRITEILNDFLRSSRNSLVKTDNISANALLDEILKIASDRIILKNISVHKFYTTCSCKLLVDTQKVTIALLNIIVNAIEAMSWENGELGLTTSIRDDGKCIVTIEDNGCGISKENIKNIFKPYFTSKPNGMGIGLAAAYDILAAHSAGVDVESEENKGTRFIISFNIA